MQKMSQKPTKERVIQYLDRVRLASVSEMSRALNVTRADIRHHLKALIAAGIISWLPADKRSSVPGRGRPSRRYYLVMHSRQDNLANLTLASLQTLLDGIPKADHLEILTKLAAMLSPQQGLAGFTTTQRLNGLIKWLNDNHYQSHWEARAEGPCVIFKNCPYITILAQFPQLCDMDRAILQHQTGHKVFTVETIDPNSSEVKTCIFSIRGGNG